MPVLAIVLCFVPFLYLGWKKMRQVSAYRAIALYWLVTGLINLPNLELFGLFRNVALQEKLNVWYTMAETPLVLFVFSCAASGNRRRQLMWALSLFTAAEAGLVAWKGFNFSTSNLIIGAGLFITLFYCISGLVQFMKQMEHTPFENAIAFVYAALLFAYSSFLIIYIFIHIHEKGADTSKDSFLLYYIGLSLSATITNLGLWGYGIRQQQTTSYNPQA